MTTIAEDKAAIAAHLKQAGFANAEEGQRAVTKTPAFDISGGGASPIRGQRHLIDYAIQWLLCSPKQDPDKNYAVVMDYMLSATFEAWRVAMGFTDRGATEYEEVTFAGRKYLAFSMILGRYR